MRVSDFDGATALVGSYQDDHTLALMPDGTVRAVGGNGFGQLGDGTTNSSTTPVTVNGLANVTAIGASQGYSFAVTGGELYAWGDNEFKSLGDGTNIERHTPVRVNIPAGITIAAATGGSGHSLALTSTGEVWSWGRNLNGQLGNGRKQQTNGTPAQIAGLSGVMAIAAFDEWSWGLKTDGTVWYWGRGTLVPTQEPSLSGVSAITQNGYALKTDGTVWRIPFRPSTTSATQLEDMSGVMRIAGTDNTLSMVTSDGALWAYGLPVYTGGARRLLKVATVTNIGAMDGGNLPYVIANAAPPAPDFALKHQYFNTKTIGTSEATSTTLSNPTATPLTISSITPTGDFSQTNNCGTTLAPGASCRITITFTPTQTGRRDGMIIVTDSGVGSPRTALLTGTGSPGSGTPALSATPVTIDFSPVNANNVRQPRVLGALQNNPARTVTVKNTGSAPATITDVGVVGTDSADYAITANTCASGTLGQGAECTITVQFTPTRGGPTDAAMRTDRTAMLSFREATQPTPTTVALMGVAGAPPMIYVHGIKTPYEDVGFEPLLDSLLTEFPRNVYPYGIQFFQYYQDATCNNQPVLTSDSRIALPYPPVNGVPARVDYFGTHCDSQSDFGLNVLLLYQDVRKAYNDNGGQRKITMACHSMGCAITRGFLAYAMEMHAHDPSMPSATDLVESVMFIQGVQAGSHFAKTFAVDPLTSPFFYNPGLTIFESEIYRLAIRESPLQFDYNRPAVYELRPQSAFYNWMRQETVTTPNGVTVPHTPALPYFNVYGDVRVVEKGCLFVNTCWDIGTTEFGDLAILPGESSSPYGTPEYGGSRFLYGARGAQNWEWAMRRDIPFYAATPLGIVGGLSSGASVGPQVVLAPENHVMLGNGNSGMPQVKVEDCANPGQQVRLDTQLLLILRGRLYGPLYNCRP